MKTTFDNRDEKDKNVGELINRQAAIEWVKTECNPYGKPTLDFESGKKVIEYLKQMPPAQKWTPCSEELPEAGVRYQVTFESGEVGYADFRNKIFLLDGSVKENVWEIERYYEEDGEVIAWMPLPEPYKAERSGE